MAAFPEPQGKPHEAAEMARPFSTEVHELLDMEPDQASEVAARYDVAAGLSAEHVLEWANFVHVTVSKHRLAFAETAALAIEQEALGLSHESVHEWSVETCLVLQRSARIALWVGLVHLTKVAGSGAPADTGDRVALLSDHHPMCLLSRLYGLEDN